MSKDRYILKALDDIQADVKEIRDDQKAHNAQTAELAQRTTFMEGKFSIIGLAFIAMVLAPTIDNIATHFLSK